MIFFRSDLSEYVRILSNVPTYDTKDIYMQCTFKGDIEEKKKKKKPGRKISR